jgi:magnesium-dependent phosphatase 1
MLVVFDLDFTLWDCGGTWCDHTNPPFYKQNGIIRDEDHRKIRLYSDVLAILEKLSDQKVTLGVASRTGAPDRAEELMQLFDIKKYFQHFEIYPGSKLSHFKSLYNKTGIPYRDMIFFDDEMRNIDEVGQLGVKVIYVNSGLTMDHIRLHVKQ